MTSSPQATGPGSPGAVAPSAARRVLEENSVWYHTIELADGIATPGEIDLRRLAPRVLPGDLAGRSALDVGTFDGFWAFEMERRGAAVVAIDVDRVEAAEWPPRSRARLERSVSESGLELGRGFRLVSELLGSRVRRVVCPVYDLEPGVIGGPVDFAFSGAIMLHLRDPVRALERIRSVLVPGGELRIVEPFSPSLTLRSPRRPAAMFRADRSEFNWWIPNLAGLASYLRAAGFEEVKRLGLMRAPSTRPMRQLQAGFSARAPLGRRA